MPNSPVLYGPNNTNLNIQNQNLFANGNLIAWNGPKNYISYNNFENQQTTGYSLAGGSVTSLSPTTVLLPGMAYTAGYYAFVCTSANATVGAVYTNNTRSFTVVQTIAAGTLLICTGTGGPTASGTLSKGSGTGDATITFSSVGLTITGTVSTTLSVTSTNPLAGLNSLSMVNTSTVSAGDMMITQPYTIDLEDQAKTLTFKFYYSLISGLANCNFSGTSANTFAIWFYDVTNAAWIQPSGCYGMTQGTGAGYVTGTFQTAANASQYQMAVFMGTGTPAFSINFDDFYLGPQVSPIGVPASQWTAYTPTFVGLGTVGSIDVYWRRVGDSLQLQGSYIVGTTTGTTASISLPPGPVITSSFASLKSVGDVEFGASSTFIGQLLATAGQTVLNYGAQGASNTGLTAVVGSTYGSGVKHSINATIPIQGWSSNVQMSSDTDSRVVASRYFASTGATTTVSTPFNFDSVDFDLTGSVTTGAAWKFTAPISGIYQMSGNTYGGGANDLKIYKNGSLFSSAGNATTATTAAFSATIKLNAGDYIDLRPASGSYTFVANGGGTIPNSNYIVITRLSGPSVIAAQDSVNMSYNTSSSTITSSLATVTFSNKVRDSQAQYSAGVYTIPVSGTYQAQAAIAVSGTFALNSTVDLQIQQTGSATQIAEQKVYAGGAETAVSAVAGDLFYCLAGDTLKVQVSSSATTPVIVSSASQNYFSIARVGN